MGEGIGKKEKIGQKHTLVVKVHLTVWIPTFAGMTDGEKGLTEGQKRGNEKF